MGVYDELKARGLIAQLTNEEKVRDLLNNGKTSFYIGFDPTADSLHVGHFVQIMVMAHMQKAGHTPIALFGGGTGMIGDPSGKTAMRRMMTREEIDHNVRCFQKQMSRLVDFSDGKAIMVNNADWLMNLNYIQFLREVGVHFSVNRMLSFECYKQRLERGLSFFELNYMLMQSYDFLVLNRKYGCQLELGGDDQWSNIIGGVELVHLLLCGGDEEVADRTLLDLGLERAGGVEGEGQRDVGCDLLVELGYLGQRGLHGGGGEDHDLDGRERGARDVLSRRLLRGFRGGGLGGLRAFLPAGREGEDQAEGKQQGECFFHFKRQFMQIKCTPNILYSPTHIA